MKKLIILSLSLIALLPINCFANSDDSLNLTKNAKSAIMIEATTGKVLYNFDANKISNVASLTKMMSLIIVFEFINQGGMTYDEIITISKKAKDMGGTQLWLEEGEKISVRDLLKGIVMASANDLVVVK